MNRSSLTAAWTSTFGAARHAVHATCWVLQGGSRVDPPACPRPADKRCYVRLRRLRIPSAVPLTLVWNMAVPTGPPV